MKVIYPKSTRNTTKRSSLPSSSFETVGSASLEGAWQSFHAEHYGVETPPKGSINVNQYAQINRLTRNKADAILRRKAQQGTLKTGMFRVPFAGKVAAVRFYWPKK